MVTVHATVPVSRRTRARNGPCPCTTVFLYVANTCNSYLRIFDATPCVCVCVCVTCCSPSPASDGSLQSSTNTHTLTQLSSQETQKTRLSDSPISSNPDTDAAPKNIDGGAATDTVHTELAYSGHMAEDFLTARDTGPVGALSEDMSSDKGDRFRTKLASESEEGQHRTFSPKIASLIPSLSAPGAESCAGGNDQVCVKSEGGNARGCAQLEERTDDSRKVETGGPCDERRSSQHAESTGVIMKVESLQRGTCEEGRSDRQEESSDDTKKVESQQQRASSTQRTPSGSGGWATASKKVVHALSLDTRLHRDTTSDTDVSCHGLDPTQMVIVGDDQNQKVELEADHDVITFQKPQWRPQGQPQDQGSRSHYSAANAHILSSFKTNTKTLKSIIKPHRGARKAPALAVQRGGEVVVEHNGSNRRKVASVEGLKRQRVRFFIPSKQARHFGFAFSVWHPEGKIVSSWQLFLVLPMAYEAWAAGFRLALGTPQDRWLRMLDITSDSMFVLDAFVAMNTGYETFESKERTNLDRGDKAEKLETDRAKIVSRYFKKDFLVLILPAITYYSVTLSVRPDDQPQEQGPNLWLWWGASLPRLVFRVVRMKNYFSAMEMNLNVSISELQLVKFALLILMSAHWIGSLYFFAARVQPPGSLTWLDHLAPIFPSFAPGTAFHTANQLSHYVLCLYKGMDGLAAIGYVSIVPTNAIEMVLSVSVQFVAIWVSAYILGTLFHYLLVSQKDPLRDAHNKKMEDLATFMNERNIPIITRKRLVEFFEFQYKKAVQRKASAALTLPRSLEVKVANARFGPILSKCCEKGVGRERGPFFGCSQQFLNAMATKLRQVFLMPGEHFIRQADMVLELCFVSSGYAEVMEGETVKRVIRSDVETPSIVGENSFFLGVQQQHSVRAPASSDIELLVLSKEHAEDLFRDYPEQQELITANLLTKFGIDSAGMDIEGGDAQEEEEDPDVISMRGVLRDTMRRRHDEAFQALAWAVTSGDLEEVRRMLRKGVDINTSNYDGKTVLHMAAVEGNYRVVELLLTEGAEKNKRDRWGNTALQDAIIHDQGPVTQLLLQWKSELNNDHVAGRLCDSASAGDIDTLKLLLEHGVDPNIGDYDARTALHLAAAEGQDKSVQYLIAKRADVNVTDRWGATPLQDAVQGGHVQVAEQILSRGGIMTDEKGAVAMCDAATEGDVRYLKLLIRCGVDPDYGDYDQRRPMHLAAAEARLLAVSYLLGVSANPNCKDRWGGTPMDDCVRGGTHRHLQCAKLLQCLGGRLSTMENTPEGEAALSTLQTIDMEDVRKVIRKLIHQGLDSKKPERATEQECLIAHEASAQVLVHTVELSHVFEVVTCRLQDTSSECETLLDRGMMLCKRLADFLDKIKTAHREMCIHEDQVRSLNEVAFEFDQVLHSGQEAEALDHFFDFEIDQATMKLYDELDHILAIQDRKKFASHSIRMSLAKDINRCLMNLSKVDEMWRVLGQTFEKHGYLPLRYGQLTRTKSAGGLDIVATAALLDDFDLMINDEETRQLFKEASDYGNSSVVSPETLLVGSEMFQNKLLERDSDDIAQVLFRSQFLCALSWRSMEFISSYARRVKLRNGHTIRLKERSILAVQAGLVSVCYEDERAGCTHVVQIGRDEVAGESWALFKLARIKSVVALKNSCLCLLSAKALGVMFEVYPGLILPLCSRVMKCVRDAETAEGQFVGMKAWECKMVREVCDKRGGQDGRQVVAELSNLSTSNALMKLSMIAKTAQQRHHDKGTQNLMDCVRESCRAPWSQSPDKMAIVALSLWKRTFSSKLKNRAGTAPHQRLGTLRLGFEIIESSWSILANGSPTILFENILELKDYLGEVGVAFFEEAFPADKMKAELDFKEWVVCWLRYLDGGSDEMTPAVQAHASDDEKGMKTAIRAQSEDMNAVRTADVGSESNNDHHAQSSWLAAVSRYLQLTHSPITGLLEDPEIVQAYEATFVAITGSLKTPLERIKVRSFLSLLLIDFKQTLTERHVIEFMDVFSSQGPKGQQVSWTDIERGLRHRTKSRFKPDQIFMSGIGSPFNPKSKAIRCWRTLQQICSIYVFVHVPARITFNPYPSMTSWNYTLVCMDVVVDSLIVLNLAMNFNISYMNKKSNWVIDRFKIARHYLSSNFWIDLLCATPFDWFGYLSGAGPRLASCFRLPKMLHASNAFRSPGLFQAGNVSSEFRMFGPILLLLHVGSCILFLLGNDAPNEDFTWYRDPVDINARQDVPYEYSRDGFGYANDPDDSSEYRTWKQYLLSFYWVASTVTATGIIEDMKPKNYGELIFTMITLVINLTVFSYVIGQVSANVLKGDEKLLKAREELGAVEDYLKSFDFAKDLKTEIKDYFQGAATSSLLSASEIYDSVSQSLRLEMSSELTRKCLDNCALFSGCSQQFKNSIRGLLREVQFESEEYLVQINTVAHVRASDAMNVWWGF